MVEIRDNPRLRASYRDVTRLGFGFLGLLVLQAVAAELLLARQAVPLMGDEPAWLSGVLAVLAFVLVFVAVGFRRHRLGMGRRPDAVAQVLIPSQRYGRMRSAMLGGFLASAAIALEGLLLFLFSAEREDLYGFLIPALLLWLVFFPSYGQWRRWYGLRAELR